MPEILARVRTALKEGGWLLLALVRPGDDPLTAPLARLRTAQWGGTVMSVDAMKQMLEAAGFSDVRALPGPPTAVAVMIAARR